MEIRINQILPNPDQPRRDFDKESLISLGNTIIVQGLVNPIAVEPFDDGQYILIDGERRLRAAEAVGLETIEAHIREVADRPDERLLLAMVANIQRKDLNPVEEARGYQHLVDNGFTATEISAFMNVSPQTINIRLMLMRFTHAEREIFAQGQLPIKDHAVLSALLKIPLEDRLTLIQQFSDEKYTGGKIIGTCHRYEVKRNYVSPQRAKNVTYAKEKVGRPIGKQKWGILAQIGRRPPWDDVVDAALRVCQACSLYEIASPDVCEQCTAAELIKVLISKR
jgi:ParB/RepB/Spo0J family partition protein